MNFERIKPLFKVEHGAIISAYGDITLSYELDLPEIFTLSGQEYEAFHHAWCRAIRLLPAGSIVHKQNFLGGLCGTIGKRQPRPIPIRTGGIQQLLLFIDLSNLKSWHTIFILMSKPGSIVSFRSEKRHGTVWGRSSVITRPAKKPLCMQG